MSDSVKVSVIPNCDLCNILDARDVPAEFDAATTMGSWANMCQMHFEQFGLGLGTGRGQRLVLR